MAKMKVHEIAKEVNQKSRDIITYLNNNGIEVTSHMSNIYDKGINLVRQQYGSQEKKVDSQPNTKQRENKNIENKQRDKQNKSSNDRYKGNSNQNRSGFENRDKPQRSNQSKDSRNRQSDRTSQGQDSRNRQSDRTSQGQDSRNRQSDRTSQGQDSRNRQSDRTSQGQDSRNRQSDRTSQGTDNRSRDNQSRRPSQGQDNRSRDNQSRRPSQGQDNRSRDNQNRRPSSSQDKRDNRQSRPDNKNTRQSANYKKQTTRNTSGKSDMGRKDFISDELNTIENDRSKPSRTKKTNNAAMATTRSETINKRRSKKKNNNVKNDKNDSKLENNSLKKGQFIKPKQEKKVAEKIKVVEVGETITIKELAKRMRIDSSDIIKKLFLQGKAVTINEEVTYEEAEEIAIEYDILIEREVVINEVEEALKEEEEDPKNLRIRPPVVCVMGHVDHGKTSLLDAIRETHVTSGEAGGITQHIGAYIVNVHNQKITFLDTPGHEAFTSMRMRGAQSTDIAILVVAADDGVMPQTVEAINHAKAAGIEIIVAVNKIDKPSSNVEKVKQELVEYELVAEDWGGDTVFVPVSAQTGEGIDTLLEMVVLTAELLELKANPNRNARGLVIEAELDKGRGPVATVLVQKGTLRVGDSVSVGTAYGNVRAMHNDKGQQVKVAGPSTPVEILGLSEVPAAGEIFVVSDTEKESRQIVETYITQKQRKLIANTKPKMSLDGLFSEIQAGNLKDLNIIVKADVQGSVEAMRQSLEKISNEEVAVRVIHGGVGAITESDVSLASASNAVIIGFNVRPDNNAKDIAATEKVDMRLYRVIYNAIEDVENAMRGMLDPTFKEKVTGHLEIREIYKASGVGNIAGAYVTNGFITRLSQVRIVRDGIVVYDGNLASLKRFQDDVKEVKTGFECGIVFEKYNDIKVGDIVEAYTMEEIPR